MFYFHKVVYIHYLGEVDVFHSWVNKFIPLYNSAKIIKIDQDFPKLWSQMYCHHFMVHSVHYHHTHCTIYRLNRLKLL